MGFTITTNTGKSGILDRQAFSYYRKRAKFRNKDNTKNLQDWRRIVIKFYDKIGDNLVDSEGGVFIKGLGYFSVIVYPKKVYAKSIFNKDGFANFHTDNYIFMPTLFGFAKGYPLLNFWSMDRTFVSKIKEGIYNKIMAGMRYKTYVSTLYTLYTKPR